jgi:hypothetical protein
MKVTLLQSTHLYPAACQVSESSFLATLISFLYPVILVHIRSCSKPYDGQVQWLVPVILATQEAEIRRTVVRSQPGQIVLETLSQKQKNNLHKKGLVEWFKV